MPIAKRRFIARLALALMLVLILICSAFFLTPLHTARANTGGYPDSGKACIWPSYNTTGYCIHVVNGKKVITYEWGDTHNNENEY